MGMIFDLAKNGFQLELMVLCSTFIELPRGGGHECQNSLLKKVVGL